MDLGKKIIQKIKSCTGSMEHTTASAKKNRSRVLGMAAYCGLSSVMFTVSPDDRMNLRIRIYSRPGENINLPSMEDDVLLTDFVIDCQEIRTKYPGLCAIDFQNVLNIVIEDIIGFDNKNNKGLFGVVEAYCSAVEEQGRKTLHTHILLWLKYWTKLMNMLNDPLRKEEFITLFTKYADQILTTRINGYMTHIDSTFGNPSCKNCDESDMIECSDQGLRNMRTKDGETEFGGKAIMKCQNCGTCITSEDIVIENINELFSIGVPRENSRLNYKSLYTHGHKRSKYNAAIEVTNMKMQLEEMDKTSISPKYKTDDYSIKCFLSGVSKQLHKAEHTKTCFKKKVQHEGRCNIPSKKCATTELLFNNIDTEWFNWDGSEGTQNLFFINNEPVDGCPKILVKFYFRKEINYLYEFFKFLWSW